MAKEAKEAKETKGKKLTTGAFRVSFPHVFEPQTTPSGEQRYSVVMLFPQEDEASIDALKNLAREAAYEKWGKDSIKSKKIKPQWPWRDGEEKAEQYDGYEGMIFATASSKQKPNVVRKNKKTGVLEKITDEADFYPGCYAVASVNAYAWEWKGKKGVSYGLINLMKKKDGERFGFSSKPEDDFADQEGTEEEDYGDTESDIFGDDDDDSDDSED